MKSPKQTLQALVGLLLIYGSIAWHQKLAMQAEKNNSYERVTRSSKMRDPALEASYVLAWQHRNSSGQ